MNSQPMNSLDQLKQYTTVVADTGDIDTIKRLNPSEATTNPSLITQAVLAGKIDNEHWQRAKSLSSDKAIDYLTVALGASIAKLIKGRVSTEVDARLSFDTAATITKAYEYLAMYDDFGIDKSRILIKIASTFEGIRAAEVLEKQGIACNLTLLFSQAQATVCADAGVTLISPFVGRISDFQKKHTNQQAIAISDDWGVNSLIAIYHYYKQHGYPTQVMGASFRNIAQIIALAGCDLLTISPALIDELANNYQHVERALSPTAILSKPANFEFKTLGFDKLNFDELNLNKLNADEFNRQHQQVPYYNLLKQGIDSFIADRAKLAQCLRGD